VFVVRADTGGDVPADAEFAVVEPTSFPGPEPPAEDV
jgi:hypothetical protein